jgi:hypothetical protein
VTSEEARAAQAAANSTRGRDCMGVLYPRCVAEGARTGDYRVEYAGHAA